MKVFSTVLSASVFNLALQQAHSRIVGHVKQHDDIIRDFTITNRDPRSSTLAQPSVMDFFTEAVEDEARDINDALPRSRDLSQDSIDTERAYDAMATRDDTPRPSQQEVLFNHVTDEIAPEDQASGRTLRKRKQARQKPTQREKKAQKKQPKLTKKEMKKQARANNDQAPNNQALSIQARQTNKYYPGLNYCRKDCDINSSDPTCGGIVVDGVAAVVGHVTLYDSAIDCCVAEFPWIGNENELCMARSTATTLEKYYPDLINGKCYLDSEIPALDLSVLLFNTPEDCCDETMVWAGRRKCMPPTDDDDDDNLVPRQNDETEEFYVDWSLGQCVQNCVGGPPCGGFNEFWEYLHQDATACCTLLNKLGPNGSPSDDCLLSNIFV